MLPELQKTECTSLEQVREHIDAIDRRMVEWIAVRGFYVRQAARFKSSEEGVRAPQRVEQVIAKVVSLSQKASADPAVVEAVYRAMIAAFVNAEMDEYRSR